MSVEVSDSSLTRRLVIALATPIFLLLAVGVILGLQVARMRSDAEWVDHSDAVVAKTYEVQTEIIDQETGVRGYLLTGEREFLEPYERAHPLDAIAALHALEADNAAQADRVTEVRRRYEAWQLLAVAALEQGVDGARKLDSMQLRRQRMEEVRAALDDVRRVEMQLRASRAATAAQSARNTVTIGLALLIALAAVLSISSRRHLTDVARSFQEALRSETAQRKKLEAEEWIQRGKLDFAHALQGDRAVTALAESALAMLASYVGAHVGVLYAAVPGGGWQREAGYALDTAAAGPERFAEGEGLIGQAARDGTVRRLTTPPDYVKVRSGTGERAPVEIVLMPAATAGSTEAVVELGFLGAIDDRIVRLLERVSENLAVAVRSARYRMRLKELLDESQRQAEELQTQQEELRVANEELQSQSDALRQAHAQLEEKADEIARASRYKSEFLANMSHELRTPLNSSLILAKLLADNPKGNLSEEQVKFANTIYTAGNDLLALINDVLDLSKIESGKVELHVTRAPVAGILDAVQRTVEPMTREKGLEFAVEIVPGAPEVIETDVQKVHQILKNLLANAVKFTERGSVRIVVSSGSGGDDGSDTVSFAVVDTGIGIAADQKDVIFEKFRQAESTTNRRFGGTGLGLSISRDLARALGGDVRVESELGRGSSFVLTLPRVRPAGVDASPPLPRAPRPRPRPLAAPSPRPSVPAPPRREGDRTVLIVEDDPTFADILVDLAHELEFHCLVAHTADDAVRVALEHVPSAVLLDMNLPDHSGLFVLDRLKRAPATRHVPIHVVSAEDRARQALEMGAAGYLMKPTKREDLVTAFRKLEERFSRRVRRILIVDDDDALRASVGGLLDSLGVETVGVGTVQGALEALRGSTFDCVVTDLTLPDASGFELLETMASDEAFSFPPVIVYTGRVLDEAEEQRLRRYSSSIIVKGARSPERLLDEVTLFLHQVEAELPADRRRMLEQARDREALFTGRRILVVEDDVRNIFALSSVLEPKGAEVLIARNGREALDVLQKETQQRRIDVVLMDLMMPEMDGLEATREIRKRPEWSKIPIIALTAKAMRDDQERCLQAGANDYVSKPLDVEKLLSLLRVWMPK